jgi:hypothetical protein
VVELCSGAICAGRLCCCVGASQDARLLCVSGWHCIRKKQRRPDLEGFPEKAVYLFDPDENESHPLESNVLTIVAQVKHYKALKKLGAGRKYFPCWSLGELEKPGQVLLTLRMSERCLESGWNSSLRVQQISR